jgi:hypothetical protein
MDGIAPGPGFVSSYVLVVAVRQLLVYIGWLIAAGLAGAGACWCCGYGAQAAWARAELARHTLRATTRREIPDPVTEEATRGIQEIEAYLSTQSMTLPRPQRIDEDET